MKSSSKISCPFCLNYKSKFWFKHISKEDNKEYPLYKCTSCKSAFIFPEPSQTYLNEFYSSSKKLSKNRKFINNSYKTKYEFILSQEIRYPNSSVDAKRIINNLSMMEPGRNFLDVGAGYGFFSYEAKKYGFEVTALELNEESRKIFMLMNGFEPLNVVFNEEFANKNAGKFDVILLSQVLEHIPMKSKPISNIYKLLSPRGICVISVPLFRSSISVLQGKNDMFITPPEHLNFFSIKGLRSLLKNNGFDLISFETYSRYDSDKFFEKLKFKLLFLISTKILDFFLYFSDRTNKGMYINSYFRKINS